MTQGRFTSEDILKGHLVQPNTLNSYTYCLNQPEDFVDLDGREFSKEIEMTADLIYGDGVLYIKADDNGVVNLPSGDSFHDYVSDVDSSNVSNVKDSISQSSKIQATSTMQTLDFLHTDEALKSIVVGAALSVVTWAIALKAFKNPMFLGKLAFNIEETRITNGLGNMMYNKGSYEAGAIGGTANALISTYNDKWMGQFIGGFFGSVITLELNNRDPNLKKKDKSQILGESISAGVIQASTSVGFYNMGNIIGNNKMGRFIWDGLFTRELSYTISDIGSIITEQILEYYSNIRKKDCIGLE